MGLDARVRREEIPLMVRTLLDDLLPIYSPRRVRNFACFYSVEGDCYILNAFFQIPRGSSGLQLSVKYEECEIGREYITKVFVITEPFKTEDI